MLPNRDSVVIVGGGPAGSAAAAILAQAGLRVTLLEKDAFPRDKLCGEFLSPESIGELARLGALDLVLAERPARIDRTRFTTSSGRVLETRLPAEGLGLSRSALDRILFDQAGHAGAKTATEAEVTSISETPSGAEVGFDRGGASSPRGETIEADLVICAHGRRARLDRTLKRPFMAERSPYVGLKRHHRPIAGRGRLDTLRGVVEIHAFKGGYCGLCFIEGEQVNVCMLLEERFLGSIDPRDWGSVTAELARRNRMLAERLEALEPAEPEVHAVAQVPFASKERAAGRLFFSGDAAGMIAPLAGDGQAMALTSARILAELIVDWSRRSDPRAIVALGAAWDRRWRAQFETRMRLGRILQRLLFDERSAAAAIAIAGSIPGLAALLVRLTRGRASRAP